MIYCRTFDAWKPFGFPASLPHTERVNLAFQLLPFYYSTGRNSKAVPLSLPSGGRPPSDYLWLLARLSVRYVKRTVYSGSSGWGYGCGFREISVGRNREPAVIVTKSCGLELDLIFPMN